VIYLEDVSADERAGTITIGDGSRFELEDRPETVVRVTMAAPAAGAGWDAFYDDIRDGWASFVHQLRFALEHHPGEERRTLQLDGAGTHPANEAAVGIQAGTAGTPTPARPRGASRSPGPSSSAPSTRWA